MKTVILCGGKGTRLREETEFRPKPMVEIGGRPILWHIMKLYAHQGFNEFVLCLGYKGTMIKEYFLNYDSMLKDFTLTMREVARTLKPNGRFLILQPNIRFCARDFWMFFDHITPLDQYSLTEALEMSGFRAVKTIVRFLPYSTKSKLPKSLFMVRAYLALPFIWRFLGQQTFVVAELEPSGRLS
jgi:NDP-sugar pyrophosphorylase family protein